MQKTSLAGLAVRPRLEVLEDRITPTVFTPTVFTDGVGVPGQTTLRDAVIAANNDMGAATDTIQLAAGTYTLTIANAAANHEVNSSQGDLNVTNTAHALVIQGATDTAGNPTTVIDQTVADRVIQIAALGGGPGATVTFKNLIIEGGNAQDDGSAGAVAGNSTAQGGGILDDGGNVTLSNVVVRSNQATGGPGQFAQGGGVFAQDGALTINSSVIQNNTAIGGAGAGGAAGFDANGGGVCYLGAGALSLTNSTVAGNTAQGGAGVMGTDGGEADGGGVYSLADTTTITASTLSGNAVHGGTAGAGGQNGFGAGGGAYLRGLDTVVNSTIAANLADGISAAGGGVYFGKAATGQFTNVTVAANQANSSVFSLGTPEGGGLDNNNGDIKPVTLVNTLVAGNVVNGHTNTANADVRGEILSGGHNLIGVADGANDPGFHQPGDQAGSAASPLNAGLGTLANNGGPTQTIALLPGSAALNAGDNGAQGVTGAFDQRGPGFARVSGGTIDIGAFEVQASVSPPPPPGSPPPGSPPPSPPLGPPPPSLFQAIISLYIAEVEKDIGFGDPAALQHTIDFNARYCLFAGMNIAPFIEQLADTNVANARSGGA